MISNTHTYKKKKVSHERHIRNTRSRGASMDISSEAYRTLIDGTALHFAIKKDKRCIALPYKGAYPNIYSQISHM